MTIEECKKKDVLPDKQFMEWAKSFSGIDGGNVNAEYWIVGIEFATGGTGEGEFIEMCNKRTFAEVKDFCKGFELNPGNQTNTKMHTFCGLLEDSKINPGILNDCFEKKKIQENNSKPKNKCYEKQYFNEGGNFFKFNLFPIPMPKEKEEAGWQYYLKEGICLTHITGLKCGQYKQKMREERIPVLFETLITKNCQKHLKIIIASMAEEKHFNTWLEIIMKKLCIQECEKVDFKVDDCPEKYRCCTFKFNGKQITFFLICSFSSRLFDHKKNVNFILECTKSAEGALKDS